MITVSLSALTFCLRLRSHRQDLFCLKPVKPSALWAKMQNIVHAPRWPPDAWAAPGPGGSWCGLAAAAAVTAATQQPKRHSIDQSVCTSAEDAESALRAESATESVHSGGGPASSNPGSLHREHMRHLHSRQRAIMSAIDPIAVAAGADTDPYNPSRKAEADWSKRAVAAAPKRSAGSEHPLRDLLLAGASPTGSEGDLYGVGTPGAAIASASPGAAAAAGAGATAGGRARGGPVKRSSLGGDLRTGGSARGETAAEAAEHVGEPKASSEMRILIAEDVAMNQKASTNNLRAHLFAHLFAPDASRYTCPPYLLTLRSAHARRSQVLCAILRRCGYTNVTVVDDGQLAHEAVAGAHYVGFDCVFMVCTGRNNHASAPH